MRSVVVDSASFTYTGTELEALAEAGNYYSWVISRFTPFLGKRVIEVGAGIGTFSQVLLNRTPLSRLTIVEPGENLIPLLQSRFAAEPRVEIVHGYFQDLDPQVTADSVVLVNVLEHIADDAALLGGVHKALLPGGTLLLLVPALAWIYGSIDEAVGHYRRYNRQDLEEKLRGTGFDIVHLSYFNLPGIVGWFLTGRVLKRKTLNPRDVRLYDRWVVPWLAKLEGRWDPPLGQSLLAIARKGKAGDFAASRAAAFTSSL